MAELEDLSLKRCLNHPGREAAARCPECRRYFCRECVIEHGERALCAECVRRLARAAAGTRGRFALLGRAVGPLVALFTAWLFFYLVAQALLLQPGRFHPTAAAAAGARK